MEASASLKQTVIHLFDAVRYSNHARELEGAASKAEGDLRLELDRLESHLEEVTHLLESMREGTDEAVKELGRQVEEFLETANLQAVEKLERRTKEAMRELTEAAASERDKALKSLETYLASEPLPLVEKGVQVRFSDGVYEARSVEHCEGGMKYEFRLATQNSGLFSKEFTLSQLGFELKIPVRLSRALLKKGSVPGFERLDQYTLASAETSGGKVRANFEKEGNGARIKVVTSGSETNGFIGVEYADQAQQVNVMTDPSLSAHVDLELLRRAMGDLVTGITELSGKKVAILRLSIGDEDALARLDCQQVLQSVLKVMGRSYQSTVKSIANGQIDDDPEMTVDLIRERLKVLGGMSASVAGALGFQTPR